ncbi:hypothetical protein GCM10010275_38920 [Streptomyces litmocidini]|nr:hypothetical protein GCM10010275_38920 [Streptomyces litmocidini]
MADPGAANAPIPASTASVAVPARTRQGMREAIRALLLDAGRGEGDGAGLFGAGTSRARPEVRCPARLVPRGRCGLSAPAGAGRGGEPAARDVRTGQTPQLGADQDRLVRPSTWVWSSWSG